MENEETTALDIARTSCFSVSVYADKDPHEVQEHFLNAGWTRYKWIAQTLGDCVWIWYEFETIEKKRASEESLQEPYKQYLTDIFTKKDLNYWKDVKGSWSGF